MALNILAMIADAIMIISLLREPLSYFRPYRNYLVAIYGAFLAFPARELVLAAYPDQSWLEFSTELIMIAAATIATLWGYVATKLYLYPEPFSLSLSLTNLTRPIYLAFTVYLCPMLLLVIAGIAPGSIIADPSRQALYVLENTLSRSVGYSFLFLAIAGLVALAFTLYPLVVLTHLRSQLKDKEVRYALKIIASSFGGISTLLLLAHALSSLGFSILGLAHLGSVILMIVAVRAFRKPTFLKAFLGVAPSLDTSIGTRSDLAMILYEGGEEKYGPLSRHIVDSVGQGRRVFYFYGEEETMVREQLAAHGVSVKHFLLNGDLRLVPLTTLYQSEGLLDEEAAITYCYQLASEARILGKEGINIIIDYGNNTKRPSQKFVEHLTDTRWTSPDHYTHVLMFFSRSAFQGQEESLSSLRSKISVRDLTESIEAFSRTVGLSHSEIEGKKILLEYDPQSDYERVMSSLLAEAASNLERIVLFTRRDSQVYSLVKRELGVKIFILTSRVSYPRVESENQVLLPVYDSSLVLDSLSRTIEAYSSSSLTIVFDNISHYIFTLGPERTYSLARQALELMISDKITAVFLMNAAAHDQKTLSMVENLFDIEIVCKLGTRVPEVRQKLRATTA